jgi:hypothetical protein
MKAPACTRTGGAQQTRFHLAASHEVANFACAAIILRDALRYGGDESLMVTWAHSVLEGAGAEQKGWRLCA